MPCFPWAKALPVWMKTTFWRMAEQRDRRSQGAEWPCGAELPSWPGPLTSRLSWDREIVFSLIGLLVSAAYTASLVTTTPVWEVLLNYFLQRVYFAKTIKGQGQGVVCGIQEEKLDPSLQDPTFQGRVERTKVMRHQQKKGWFSGIWRNDTAGVSRAFHNP